LFGDSRFIIYFSDACLVAVHVWGTYWKTRWCNWAFLLFLCSLDR